MSHDCISSCPLDVRLPLKLRLARWPALPLLLQSYAGGANLWGEMSDGPGMNSKQDGQDPRIQQPSHNDGLLEVCTKGWWTLLP